MHTHRHTQTHISGVYLIPSLRDPLNQERARISEFPEHSSSLMPLTMFYLICKILTYMSSPPPPTPVRVKLLKEGSYLV